MTLRPLSVALLAACLVATLVGAGPVAAADDPTPGPTAAGEPTAEPTAEPSPPPTARPSPEPDPTAEPGASPRPTPSPEPVPDPTASPDPTATGDPSADPSAEPSASPDPSPGETPPGSTVGTPWSGRYNLYRRSAWVRQYRNYTCTAASAQTMINLIRKRADHSVSLQLRIIKYARAHDYLRRSAGSDPAGWARAIKAFGGGAYRWKTFSSRPAALRYAATRMLATGKPVGLLVWRGRHAWTMTGFTSPTDPRTDPKAVITGVYVAPPLVGVDPRPNTYLKAASLTTFARYRERDGLRVWIGTWVVVAP